MPSPHRAQLTATRGRSGQPGLIATSAILSSSASGMTRSATVRAARASAIPGVNAWIASVTQRSISTNTTSRLPSARRGPARDTRVRGGARLPRAGHRTCGQTLGRQRRRPATRVAGRSSVLPPSSLHHLHLRVVKHRAPRGWIPRVAASLPDQARRIVRGGTP